MNRGLGIGLVGTGGFGAFCVRALEDLPGARIVAVMDVDRTRAEAIAPSGATAHDTLEALLDDRAVDIVHIATPPVFHAPIARQSAEHGKHVFVEKPLAIDLDAARAAIRAAERSGVQLSVDYVLRHHPIHRLALEVTRLGVLGGLQHFGLENFASVENLPAEHWFWDPSQSGGIHVEHGVHFFDLLLAHAGRDPDAVIGTAQARSDGRFDRVGALLRFGDALVATVYHSFNRTRATEQTILRLDFERGHATVTGWIPTRMEIEGTVAAGADLTLRALLGDALTSGNQAARRNEGRVPIAAIVERPDRERDYMLAIRAGMSELVAAIREGRPLTVTPQDGLRSLDIALRASEAI